MPKPVSPIVGADTFAVNARNEVCLIMRSDNGMWALPGGAQNLGEAPEQCENENSGKKQVLKSGSSSSSEFSVLYSMNSGLIHTKTGSSVICCSGGKSLAVGRSVRGEPGDRLVCRIRTARNFGWASNENLIRVRIT